MRAGSPNQAAQQAGGERRQPWETHKRQGQPRARLPVRSRPPALAPHRSLSPSLPPSQAASRGARSRAPSPLPSPPPTSREQETRGPAEGDQVGEAVLGEGGGGPGSPAAVYLIAASDASEALWAQPAPGIPRLGVI